MVPLWFTLSALCFVGAVVLLYVDIDRRRGRSRRRKSWARSHGFDYERESADILKRWKRGVMSTVGDVPAHNVVLGQIRGEAVYIFDLEDVATVIALHRKVGTNVVVDLRLKGLKEPRENDIWLLGAIGPRMVYSTNLDAARRACDRRMVTFAHTAPDCAEIMWNEQNWTLVAMPITSTRAQWDEGLRTVRQFNDLLRVLPPHPAAQAEGRAGQQRVTRRSGSPAARWSCHPGAPSTCGRGRRGEPPRPGAVRRTGRSEGRAAASPPAAQGRNGRQSPTTSADRRWVCRRHLPSTGMSRPVALITRAGIDLAKLPPFLWLGVDAVVGYDLVLVARGKVISVPACRNSHDERGADDSAGLLAAEPWPNEPAVACGEPDPRGVGGVGATAVGGERRGFRVVGQGVRLLRRPAPRHPAPPRLQRDRPLMRELTSAWATRLSAAGPGRRSGRDVPSAAPGASHRAFVVGKSAKSHGLQRLTSGYRASACTRCALASCDTEFHGRAGIDMAGTPSILGSRSATWCATAWPTVAEGPRSSCPACSTSADHRGGWCRETVRARLDQSGRPWPRPDRERRVRNAITVWSPVWSPRCLVRLFELQPPGRPYGAQGARIGESLAVLGWNMSVSNLRFDGDYVLVDVDAAPKVRRAARQARGVRFGLYGALAHPIESIGLGGCEDADQRARSRPAVGASRQARRHSLPWAAARSEPGARGLRYSPHDRIPIPPWPTRRPFRSGCCRQTATTPAWCLSPPAVGLPRRRRPVDQAQLGDPAAFNGNGYMLLGLEFDGLAARYRDDSATRGGPLMVLAAPTLPARG